MINYIKDLFTEIRPEIRHLAERLEEGYMEYDVFRASYNFKIASLGVSFYYNRSTVYDFSVNYYEFPLTNKETKFLLKSVQKLEKQREEEKTQKAYSLLKSNLEKK